MKDLEGIVDWLKVLEERPEQFHISCHTEAVGAGEARQEWANSKHGIVSANQSIVIGTIGHSDWTRATDL